MTSLHELFNSLPISTHLHTNGQQFIAHPIPEFESHRIGKDIRGHPSLLLSMSSDVAVPHAPSIILENLSVHYSANCRVIQPNGVQENNLFTVIQCTSDDSAIQSYFLRIAGTLVPALGERPARREVERTIGNLVELFRVLTEPPRKSVQGLWAELFLIAVCHSPETLLKAWHSLPEETYDFSLGSQRIEVKSSVGRVRQHHFNLEQLHPPQGTQVLIASIFVERRGGGQSIARLMNEVSRRVFDDVDLRLRLEQTVGLTLGSSWRLASEETFDFELARDSLRFYDSAVIPCISLDIPPEVSDIHFRSDLSHVLETDRAYYKSLGGLFGAVL